MVESPGTAQPTQITPSPIIAISTRLTSIQLSTSTSVKALIIF